MKLADLEPAFVRRLTDKRITFECYSRDDADGLLFLCPLCAELQVQPHLILLWRTSVPLTTRPKPGRWEFDGSGLDDLTIARDVILTSGCRARFRIDRGEIRF